MYESIIINNNRRNRFGDFIMQFLDKKLDSVTVRCCLCDGMYLDIIFGADEQCRTFEIIVDDVLYDYIEKTGKIDIDFAIKNNRP